MSFQLISPLKAIALAAALTVGASAHAAITVYTNQTDFVNNVYAPGYDTYDDLRVTSYPDTLLRSAGTYDYRAYSAGGLFGAGGAGGDYWLSNVEATNPIVFSGFSNGAQAFGGYFFPTEVSGQYTGGNVILTAIDGTAYTYNLAGATTGSFLGFVSDAPLLAVTLGSDSSEYWPTANNVIVAVPEPATYGMLLAGMGLIGVAARRRR